MSPVIGYARSLEGHPTGLPNLAYAWLEAPLAAQLARVTEVPQWHDIDVWPAGRLFGESGEYRWQRDVDGTIHGIELYNLLKP